MTIAFYFSGGHLGRWNWRDFLAGQMPASGTDAQFLHLLARMLDRPDIEIVPMFSGSMPGDGPPGAVAIPGLVAASTVAKDRGADAIVFNNRDRDESMAGVTRCSELDLPVIVWDQNGPAPDMRCFFSHMDIVRRIVCVSQSHADTFRDHPIFEKIAAIHNALTFDAGTGDVSFDSRASRVCFLGATIAQKGFHHLVRAWPEVRAACPSAELLVIGSSRLYDVGRETGPLGLSNPAFERDFVAPCWGTSPDDLARLGIRLAGLLPPVQVASALRGCLIAVVNPCARNGSYETFCVSAIEAQASGCAVIGGRRLGLRETVRHGKTGILIRREKHLARAIIGLIRDLTRTRQMGEAGARWVLETFSTARTDDLWFELFRDVIIGTPNRPLGMRWRLATLRSTIREFIRLIRGLLGGRWVGKTIDSGD